jgi:hypothetical protein
MGARIRAVDAGSDAAVCQRIREREMKIQSTLIGGFLLAGSVVVAAQSPPPAIGGSGNQTIEGTTNGVYRALNVVVVRTIDGVEHMIHYTKDLLLHGGKGTGPDALQGLKEGSTVVVHYTVSGTEETAQEIDRIGDADGLKKSEGVVVDVNRRRQQITVRFADRTTETLQLTARAVAEAGRDLDDVSKGGVKVVVYYSDEGGRSVAHYFRKVS